MARSSDDAVTQVDHARRFQHPGQLEGGLACADTERPLLTPPPTTMSVFRQ